MKTFVRISVFVLFAMPVLPAAKKVTLELPALSSVPSGSASDTPSSSSSSGMTIRVAERQLPLAMRQDFSLSTAAACSRQLKEAWHNGPMPTHRRNRTFDAASADFLREELKNAKEVNEEFEGKDPIDMQKMTGSLHEYEVWMGALIKTDFFTALSDLDVAKATGHVEKNTRLIYAKDVGKKGVLHTVLQYEFDNTLSPRARSNLEERQKALVIYLVQKNADVNAKDDQAMTPLHYAAIHNVSVATVQELFHGLSIDAIRVLLNQQDKQGNAALHYAILQKNTNLVLFLLTYWASIDLTNEAGQSAVDLAEIAPARIKKAIEKRKKEQDCCSGCLSCLRSCFCCS
jgi:hypothetical protein